LVNAIAARQVPRIYICNIMSEPGETQGYTVSKHIEAIDRSCGQYLFDAVLVQKRLPSQAAIDRYLKEGSTPVMLDRKAVIDSGRRIVIANVMSEDDTTVRHDPKRLAKVLVKWYERTQGAW
ncbi:MAG: 2-phospho-L-lactate transferase CofD family protein, partial [Cyanobacteria bacterium J06648_16]